MLDTLLNKIYISYFATEHERKKCFEPIDPQVLQEARDHRIKVLKMHDILREVGLYCVYVAVAMLISHDCQDPRAYLVRQNMVSAFIDGGRGPAANSSNSLMLVLFS